MLLSIAFECFFDIIYLHFSDKKIYMSILKLFSGTSHPELVTEIAKYMKLDVEDMDITKFANNEIYVKPRRSLRGCDAFIIQTCTQKVNEDFMELFIIIDALKRSFADKIHVVMPHFGYSRQDRISAPREPISAKLMADLLTASGADHVMLMNLHSDQEQGFFNFPVDNLTSYKLFVDYFKKKRLKNLVVVSPDMGAAISAKKFADMMGAELAVLHKSRPVHNISEVIHVIGNVMDKTCLIFDDMIDTGGTVVSAKEALIKRGANPDVYVGAVHPIFSYPAISRIKNAGFKEVVVANTIPIPRESFFPELTVLSVANLLARTIFNVHKNKSVTSIN